jgi:NADPH:quinone reductase-like Zn-dependent oxidoreductase
MGDVADMSWGLAQVAEGRIRPVLDRTLPLGAAAEAHRLLARGPVRGNVVLLPWEE